ncbi:hypothetical protein GCM10022252_73320 [Streptosporangium oxazolinicum]|uniref:Transcriptional regulator n=1 Tax=Streptosporangium oxazolinicum TaxID=909287 RepID=A0ABP8BJH2_9ACTN
MGLPTWAARLKAARHGECWTQKEVARRLTEAAREHAGICLPGRASLTRMLRDWETGRARPRSPYPQLLALVYDLDEASLFSDSPAVPRYEGVDYSEQFDPEDEDRLIHAARQPRRLDAAVIGSLGVILAEQRRVEDALGSECLIVPVRAELATVEGLLAEARGKLRTPMLDMAAQYAQFSGWLHANTGREREADVFYDRVLEYGTEVGAPDMVATALSMKGHLAWLGRKVGPLIGLSQAAQRDSATSAGLRALAAQQEARGHALAGEADETDRLLDQAVELALKSAERPDREPPWIYFYSSTYLTLQRGLAYRYLGRNGQAVDLLKQGLGALAVDLQESEWAANYIYQLAFTHAAEGEPEEASAVAMRAVTIAHATSSARLAVDLSRLHSRLVATWPDVQAVMELGEALPKTA